MALKQAGRVWGPLYFRLTAVVLGTLVLFGVVVLVLHGSALARATVPFRLEVLRLAADDAVRTAESGRPVVLRPPFEATLLGPAGQVLQGPPPPVWAPTNSAVPGEQCRRAAGPCFAVRAVAGDDGPRTLLVFYRPAPAVAGPLTVAFVLSVVCWLGVSCGAGVLLLRALRRADESRRRLLAGLAHDLGTPLTSIRGFAETHLSSSAAAGTAPSDERRGWTVVYREAVRLQGLVEDILMLSRIESGRLALVPRPFDLREAVRSAADRAALAGAALPQVELPDGEAPVTADRDRVDQVLANLVDNAYRHGGGQDVRIVLAPAAGGWRLEVTDRGPGIPAAARSRLFRPFEGSDGGRRNGIGLAIARELVTLHGGELSLEDRPGGGTRAVVELPYSPPNR